LINKRFDGFRSEGHRFGDRLETELTQIEARG
jgi:hypothetical protein